MLRAALDEEQRRGLRDEVARSVMGWRLASVPWAYSGSTNCWLNDDDAAVLTQHAWRPDEDESQNSQVLQQMLTLGFDCSAEFAADENVVSFTRDLKEGVPVCHAERRVAMLLAALAALT